MSGKVLIFQNAVGEPPGQIADYLSWAGVSFEILPMYSYDPPEPDWNHLSGLVVLGGPMNVDQTEEYPFLMKERQWLLQATRREIPVLGICLGAQLLARTLGARVFPNPVKEIGWYELTFTPAAESDSLFSGVPWKGMVFQWHGDTFTLPEGAALLATGSECVHQAFRFGSCAWGLQFHLEVTPALIDAWLAEAEKNGELQELGRTRRQILSETPGQFERMQRLTHTVLSRFAGLCAYGTPR